MWLSRRDAVNSEPTVAARARGGLGENGGVVARGRRDRVRFRVEVHGRVHGVWFRDSCRREAVELGLAGWVRNCSDGSVEAVFEGPESQVARAVSWCRQGPPRAEVDAVDVNEEPSEGVAGFRVR